VIFDLFIDFTDDINDKEGYPDIEKDQKITVSEVLNHSKSSYLSGPVRYSKMNEEEAATVFEQRQENIYE